MTNEMRARLMHLTSSMNEQINRMTYPEESYSDCSFNTLCGYIVDKKQRAATLETLLDMLIETLKEWE